MALRRPLLLTVLASLVLFPAASAGANDAPPAASAIGVAISIPGAPDAGTSDAGGFSYPHDGSIVDLSKWAPSTTRASDSQPGAHASVRLAHGVLFGGALTFSSAVASADAVTSDDGDQSATPRAVVTGLTVHGSAVADPTPGAKIDLGDWGYVVVEGRSSSHTPEVAASATALDVHLTSKRAGLPAGSEIVIGSVAASIPAPPADGSGGSGGSGGGSGGSGGGSGGSGDGSGGGSGRSGGSGGSGGSPGSADTGGSGVGPGGTSGVSEGSGGGSGGRSGGAGATGTTPGPRVDVHHAAVVVPVHHRHRGRHIQRLPVRPPVAHPRLLEGPLGARIVAAAESQLGWPYVWGGESELQGGFDCSGLVDYAYAAAGHALPGRPTAEVLWLLSTPIRRAALMPGDLLFLLDNDNYAYHVAIYAGHGLVVVAAHRGTAVSVVPLASVPWSAFGRLFHPHAERPANFRDVAGSRFGRSAPIDRRPPVHRRGGITVLSAAVALQQRHRRQAPPKRGPQRTTPAAVVRDEPLAQPASPRQRPAAG